MASQVCVYGVCFPVPSALGSLVPGASAVPSSSAGAATTAAATTSNAAAATTAAAASTFTSAGQTFTSAASAAGASGGATVTQTLVRTVTAAASGAAQQSGAAGGAGAGAGGFGSVGPNGFPAIPSGIVIPDNFKLPPGFQLPPKPHYEFDVNDRLSDAVLYAILLFPTLFLLWKHGRRGLFIWPAMAAFCILRIIQDAMFMWPGGDLLKVGAGWIVTGAMIIFLFILFPVGINFEASGYIPTSSRGKRFLILGFTLFVFILGTILGTIGEVPLSLVAQIRNKPYNLKMARAGWILILIFLIITWFHSIILYLKTSRSITPLSQRKRVRALLAGSILASPFIWIRVGRSIHFVFKNRVSLNPLYGSFVTIFVFVWLMQLLAYVIILCAGFAALRIKYASRHASHRRSGSAAANGDVVDTDDELEHTKAEEQRAAGAGAVAPTSRRHRFMRRRHRDEVAADPVGAQDGYYPPEKHHDVREV